MSGLRGSPQLLASQLELRAERRARRLVQPSKPHAVEVGEHLQLVHDGEVVARLGPPHDGVVVADILTSAPDVEAKVRRELDYYLLELAAPDPRHTWRTSR